ncbi:MAG: MoxR family ATPase [Deltaproteobacteria bacterium]|nr:MoxR family ATPase [Deltaproteobacteria bacterium]
MQQDVRVINELVRKESAFIDDVVNEVEKVIVGQRTMVERILLGLLTGGHILLEGVPGLAKTLTVNTLAQTLDARFQRIQFTPDLLPADLVGTMIYNQKTGEFAPKKGPIFSQLVLADEINRAPAKVQSALLEAMQERQVTIGDTTYPLDRPFFVMATQNPIDQEGTYPLPEAQVDRFMMLVKVGYPTLDEERVIMDRQLSPDRPEVRKVITPAQLESAQRTINEVYLDDKVKEYILKIIFATREPSKVKGLEGLTDLIQFGASPRASVWLARAARAHAFMKRRGYVIPEDIKALAPDVLRHRVIPTYEAEARDISSDRLIQSILEAVEVP